jgi:hypothetical protein
MPGTYWKRGCKHTDDNCLGDLTAGTYASQFVAPRLTSTESWQPVFGGVTYTVPDGWSNSDDWPQYFTLVESDRYRGYGPDGPPADQIEELSVLAKPIPNKVTTACDSQPVTSVEHTVRGYIDWIVSQPSLQATAPHPITIDGRSAEYVDLTLAPDWTQGCADDPGHGPASVFMTTEAAVEPERFGISANENVRVVVVDIGGGDLAVIWVNSTYPGNGWMTYFQRATEVFTSMQFK